MRNRLLLVALLAFVACVHRDATIIVNSRPPGAAIWFDGENTGFVTPHTFTGVYAGSHWLKVALPDCYWEDTFTLSPKETRTFEREIPYEVWRTAGGLKVRAPPAVAPDGTIYVVTGNARLLGYYPSGAPKSSRALPARDANSVAVGDDGRIYVKFGSSLVAFSPQGESLWSRPAAHGGGIALGRNGVVYSSGGPWLNACDREGVALWSRPLSGLTTPPPPVVGTDGMVYVTSSTRLLALDSAGAIRWTGEMNLNGYGSGPLALGTDGTVYLADYRHLYAVAPGGSLRWTFPLDSYYYYYANGPSVDPDGTVYFNTGDRLLVLNPDGTGRWSAPLDGYSVAPVVSEDGRVYVAGSQTRLAAFKPDGTLLWQVYGYGGDSFHPVLVDSTLLVADSKHGLTAYGVSGTGPAPGWPMFQHDAQRSGRAR
jgi:sugar lactone lactonase YvrE